MSRKQGLRSGLHRLLPLAFGAAAIIGLVMFDGIALVAQAQKAAKSAKTKDGDEAPKAKKTEPAKYVTQIPPVTDQLINSSGAKQVAKINDSIRANWIANKVNPSERCTDYEFIRRASLDIIGRIATEKEIDQFTKQSAATRRSWLVEQLLKSPEYAENLANIWTTMLLTRSGSKKDHQNEMRGWLKQQFDKADNEGGGADWSKIVTELLTATGQSDLTNERAVNFIAHHIGEEIRQDDSKKGKATKEELVENGRYDMVPLTSRTTRLFLGVRTQCVQCHDHPANSDISQSLFWGINAFFRPTPRHDGPRQEEKQRSRDAGRCPRRAELQRKCDGLV
jgi:hypothetical protein